MSQQVHLLDRFNLVHRQDPELLAARNDGGQPIGFVGNGSLLQYFGRGLAVAAPMIVLALIPVYLPVQLVQGSVKRGLHLICALLCAQD